MICPLSASGDSVPDLFRTLELQPGDPAINSALNVS